MARTIPTYTDQKETYQADACLPLVQASERGDIRIEAISRGHYPGRRLPRGVLPGVKTLGFWDAQRDQSWGLDWHRNEGIELSFLERGHVGFACDGNDFDLCSNHLIVTRPWQRHRVGNPHVAAGRLHWLILDVGVRRPHQPWRWPSWVILAKNDLDHLTDMLRHHEQPIWPASPQICRCFRELARAVETDGERAGVSEVMILLNELLWRILEMLQGQNMTLDQTLSGTRRTVELFLADLVTDPEQMAREWTVHRMAHECGLGATRFMHYCSQLTNMTPLHYLNHLRLERAASLLVSQPTLSTRQVAAMCGFSSAPYFATAFGRRFKCTPRVYRNRACKA